ncbi:MAG: carotenoid biosynthesis protein, partial [Ktedonobacterales bacterium]|nr:carotenoid biosynthesis protein [Ktedonobacterales bacterium]
YWVWGARGPYFGIPTTNFVGWAALCALLCGIVQFAWPRGGTRHALPTIKPIPPLGLSAVWLYVLTDAMFAFIDLTHGLWGAAAIGAVTLGCLALRTRAAYHKE